jgi:predicted ATPase
MLKSIRLQNFLSFKDETVDLHPNANVLVGINGSGKSNFLHAIGLLRAAFSTEISFEEYFANLGGYDFVHYRGDEKNEPIVLTYKILSDPPTLGIVDYIITIDRFNKYTERVDVTKSKGKKENYLEVEDGEVRYTVYDSIPQGDDYYVNVPNNEAELYNGKNLIFKNIINLQELEDYSISKFLKKIDNFPSFNLSNFSPLKKAGQASIANRLLPSGENFIPLLNKFNIEDRFTYKKIQELLNEVNPSYEGFDFQHLGMALNLILHEKGYKKSTTIEQISDGTLKYLILLIAILNPNHGKLICFDEPETYLHFTMVNKFVDLVKDSDSQFIITTHNPEVVNLFGLDSVIAFERTDEGSVIFKPDPIAKYGEELASWGAGSLWVNGYFDNK